MFSSSIRVSEEYRAIRSLSVGNFFCCYFFGQAIECRRKNLHFFPNKYWLLEHRSIDDLQNLKKPSFIQKRGMDRKWLNALTQYPPTNEKYLLWYLPFLPQEAPIKIIVFGFSSSIHNDSSSSTSFCYRRNLYCSIWAGKRLSSSVPYYLQGRYHALTEKMKYLQSRSLEDPAVHHIIERIVTAEAKKINRTADEHAAYCLGENAIIFILGSGEVASKITDTHS